MANPNHLAILHEGVDPWNAWRQENPEIIPDLAGANLARKNLNGIDLSGANLAGASFSRAYLREAKLEETNLCDADLREINLSDALMDRADLSRANLTGADLFRVHLCRASLSGANLKRAKIVEAYLDASDISQANLTKVDCFVVDFRGARMAEAILDHAKFFACDFTGADLVEARLWGTELFEANLTQAILQNASLWLACFTRCNLSEAVVENALVKDIRLQELEGMPKPPSLLRLDEKGNMVLFGINAQGVFRQSAIVEVHLNLQLTDLEQTCYQLHFVNLHRQGWATSVDLSGQRRESSGTVLSFQSNSYEEIYRRLPDLLAPFPRSQAIDWDKTLDAIPDQERGKILWEPFRNLAKTPPPKWPFANRLAEVFMNLRNVCVSAIKQVGKSPHLQIGIVQDSLKAQLIAPASVAGTVSEYYMVVPLDEKNEVIIT
ncbi:MAG TPA: pentapeptide repeat-containing protein, partial [bacterium]|nr:pentapeptide repeat-containing protein [bacterium]